MARAAMSALVLGFLLAILLGPAAVGQTGGHPFRGSLVRPLQERLAQADLVLIAEVVGLSDGRIEVAGLKTLLGTAPERFEIKRRRSVSPPLAAQDRALLLLRGARSPFVLVDQPAETIRLVDAPGEVAWSNAVRVMLEHRNEPSALASSMLGWVDNGPASLRDTALISLGPLMEASVTLRDEIAFDRATAAANPDLPAEARGISAQLAGASDAGQDQLVAELVQAGELEPTALALALRFGSLRDHPDLGALYERALHSERPELRLIAAQDSAPALRVGPPAKSALSQLATDDPDKLVRRAAQHTLARLP